MKRLDAEDLELKTNAPVPKISLIFRENTPDGRTRTTHEHMSVVVTERRGRSLHPPSTGVPPSVQRQKSVQLKNGSRRRRERLRKPAGVQRKLAEDLTEEAERDRGM